MKYIYSILFFLVFYTSSFSQTTCPTNLSFDANNMSFWEFKSGLYTGSYIGNFNYRSGGIVSQTINTIPSKISTVKTANDIFGYNTFTIYKANADGSLYYDEKVTSLPKVPVINGYKYKNSVRLGSSTTGGSADKITFRINVPASATDYNLTYAYAAILQDVAHVEAEQPAFVATVTDLSTNTKIECASKRYYSNTGLPIMNGARYESWREVSIDLSQYAGKTIELKFEAFDCKPSGHYGYAYLAFRNDGCGVGTITGNNIVCNTSTSLTYSTPAVDGATYTWTLPVGWTGSSTSNTITVNPNNNSGGNITVTPSQSCGNITTRSIAVSTSTISPTTPTAVQGNTTVCAGSNNLTYFVPEVAGASSYTWTYPSGWTIVDGLNTNKITFNANTNPGNITVSADNLCGSSSTSTASVSITSVPLSVAGTITGVPGTIQCPNYYTDNTVNLTLGTSTGTTQNWLSSIDGGVIWSNITNTNSILNITPNQSTLYKAIVKNGSVCVEDESDPVLVNVYSPIQIINQPIDVNTCSGVAQTFTVNASGDGTLAYNWQVSSNNGISWTDINASPTNYSGFTSATLTVAVANVITANNGFKYRCIVSSSVLCSPVTSTASTMFVSAAGSAVITTQPISQTFCSGSVSNIFVNASGPSLVYQWKEASTLGGTYTNISGATNAILSISTTTTSDKFYKCLITESCGTFSVTSDAANVVVASSTVVSQTISSTISTICAGSNKTFTASPTNGGTSPIYAWYKNGSIVTGQTIATYSTTSLVSGDVVYATIVSNKACAIGSPASSNSISTIVNTLPTVNAISGLSSVNIGSTISLTNTTPSGVWSSASPSIATVSSGTVTGVSVGNVNIFYTVTDSQTPACTNFSSKTITVNDIAPAGLTYTSPNVYTVGTAIGTLTPTSTGGAIASYAVSPSLPAGLTINATTGVITGMPSAVSTQTSYVVTGTNASGTVTATVVMTVNIAPPAGLTYTSPNVYTVGVAIGTLTPTSTGGAIASYAVSPSLPAGLTINATTGVITGMPSAVSTQTSYVVTGTNASGTVTATVVMTVNIAPPAGLTYTSPNVYTVGVAIGTLTPTSTGGAIASYAVSPSLPTGLTINSTTGVITGMPSAVSTQTSYVVTGTNASGTVTATVVMTVNSGIAPQPQGSLNAIDFKLLAKDTVILKLTVSNGSAPLTLILNNSYNTLKDTIRDLTPINSDVTFKLKQLDTTKIYTIFKLIDANDNVRTSGFTKDTTKVNVLKPKIVLTLKADPTVKQADNSFKTKLLLKIKNAGDLDLKNVQVNANLSNVFPQGLNYKLDSVRVLSGNLSINPNYNGAGSATAVSSLYNPITVSNSENKKTYSVLDQNFLFSNGVSLNKNEEGEVVYYVSIGATTQNVTIKLQFETAGAGILTKTDGSSSSQETKSKSDDGTNINQHPDITNDGLPLPTYVPLIPNEKIGASLSVSASKPVTGGYEFHFIAKIKNFGNINLDSIRIEYDLNKLFPSPDQAILISNPIITRGNIVYNTSNYNGNTNIDLFKYGGDLHVGDSAMYEYDLKVITNTASFTWPNYFIVFAKSINSGLVINDTSMAGLNPDPNNDNDPIEKFFTSVTINYKAPAPPVVENKTYVFSTTIPANIGGLVKSTPTGTIPVWCNEKTAACLITPPATPTQIGRYIFALRSYDTVTLLYSEAFVYDTIIIKPPVPVVVNKKYIIGNSTNPLNIFSQVTGMTGSIINFYRNAVVQTIVPTLGSVPGITRYTSSQTVNTIESDTVGYTVTMLEPAALLHLQKLADEPKLQTNSTFNITYTFIVTNRTNDVMSNVLVTDDLQNTFPAPTSFDIVSLSSTGGLLFNTAFNGKTDIQLLKSTSSLAASAIDTIRLTVNLQPKGFNGTVNNVAIVSAVTTYGSLNIRSSTKGYADETTKLPTPVIIPDLIIDIPEAFSPNRDGVNDRFVILKPFGSTLELEVFNRWGNIVYYNANYNNDWDGRGTNNFIGQDLMDGGYYYSLKVKSANGNSQIFKGFVLIQR